MILRFFFTYLALYSTLSFGEIIYDVNDPGDDGLLTNSSQCCSSDQQAPNLNCCSLRMAWNLCLNQTDERQCEINLKVSEVHLSQSVGKPLSFAIETDQGEMVNNDQVSVSLNGPGSIRLARVGQSGVHTKISDSFPFNYTASDTQNAERNYTTVSFEACQGDLVNIYTCYTVPVDYASDDTYLRLYGPSENANGMSMLAADDDFCGKLSFIMYQFVYPGCVTYELHAGCNGDKTCHGTVDGYMSDRISAFPVTTPSMTDTNDAQQDYVSVEFTVCAGQVMQLSSCFSGYEGNPYFRLIDDNDVEVDENDDECGEGAQITYTDSDVFTTDNLNECTQKNYSLHIGCSSASTCAANVTGISWNPVNPTRFVEYDGSLSSNSNNNEKASLKLNDLKISYFGDPSLDGGAIHANGGVNLNFIGVDFLSNIGNNGAAIYLDDIMPGDGVSPANITLCSFKSNQANYGAVYLNKWVDHLTIDSCLFDQNEEWGLYVWKWNDYLTVTNSTFNENVGNGDDVGGGGIGIDYSNKYSTVSKSNFVGNTAQWGGGLYFQKYNDYGSIIECYFSNNRASKQGGAIYVYQYNDFIYMKDVRFDSNLAFNGGAMKIRSYNDDYKIESCIFSDNMGTSNSGGIDVRYGNDNMEFRDCIFIRNRAGNNGGALRFNQLNGNLLFG